MFTAGQDLVCLLLCSHPLMLISLWSLYSSSVHVLAQHTPNLCSDPAQQMIKSLKKAMAPVLSDVTVEWVFPETTEVLISPVSTSSLFPGERLVGYGIVCDASLYISHPRSVSILDIP